MDYTEHVDARKLRMEKVEAHIPDWYHEWKREKAQFNIQDDTDTEPGSREEMREQRKMEKKGAKDTLEVDAAFPKREKNGARKSGKTIMKVEDLFSPKEGGN